MKLRKLGDFLGRAVQFGFALLLLILLMPLFAILFVAVVVDSGPPFLYRGWRIGWHGRAFWMYKIRTLYPGAEQKIGAALLRRNDDSITRVGRYLRYSKLDELPQLLNILRGDMNFVGPRPVRSIFYDQYVESIPRYAERFQVKPGLTGLAQLRGKYESSPWEKLQHELEFVENDSLALRLKIVLWTIGLLGMNLVSPRFSFHRSEERTASDEDGSASQNLGAPDRTQAKVAGEA